METIRQFILDQPLWVWIAASGGVLLVAAVVIGALVRRALFRRKVRNFLAIVGEKDRSAHFTDNELLRRTGMLEKFARSEDRSVITQLGLDRLWSDRLYQKERPSDFRRVLSYVPSTGLFSCFLVALNNGRLAATLRAYLEDNSDFLVFRNLALSGRGEPFSGSKALHFFHERLDEVREMTGDPEWASRYFAVKILLYDDDERSVRALWESFVDPHPLVRRTLAEEFKTNERERLYARLEDLFLHDPVFEVRKAARTRIRKEFQDLYRLDASQLDSDEAYHVIELLDPDNPDDENAAMLMLASRDHELRLASARFLTHSNALEKLLQQAEFSDRKQLERTERILTNAASVNVVDFLESLNRNPSPAALFLGAKVLTSTGPQPLITDVAERVFRLQDVPPPIYEEIYTATIAAISTRGTEEALTLMTREFARRRDTPALLRCLLTSVPTRASHIMAETLFVALLDPDFPERESLRHAIRQLETSSVLARILDIVSADRTAYPHQVRIDAIMLLGELRLPYALHEILEHLPILPLAEAREFTRLLDRFQSDQLEAKAKKLLDSVDGNIRAAIIAALPATGKKSFLPKIREALGDADPDVRVAASWALVDYEESRALSSATSMLRDPVERVRVSVARAIGTGGGPSALASLETALNDENEVDSVKHAAIEGLAASKHADAVDILVRALETHEDLTEELQKALARKRDSGSLARLIEDFKDSDPALRDKITYVFRLMGESAEPAIATVLEEQISGLQEALAEILEATGHVEARIRLLSHRDPAVRRSAANFLSKVGSKAAFRGIVMAARDPDSDVRVAVTKALERLATKEGKEILKALENDPDRRIRNYTHWAMERLRAKAL